MIVTWNQIMTLLPILIIGLTIIVMMISIVYRRDHFRHAVLTIIGLSLAIIVLLTVIWKNHSIQNMTGLIYIDNFSVLYIIMIIISTIASSISAYTWLLRYPANYRDEFYLLLLISSIGGILLIISNNLIILFLGIELISLPLLGLISYAIFEKSAIAAGIKYIILSGMSSAFLLFGIALIYAETSCLSFFEIQETLLSHNNSKVTHSQSILLIELGLVMMMVGFGFKLSFVPFHSWAPDIYQRAPSAVSMYLTTSVKIAVVSVLIRFLSILPEQCYKVLYIFLSSIACISMLFGSIVAIQQNNIKRILAYSSITSSGYLLVPLITSYTDYAMSQEAIGVYLTNYLFSNVGAFGIINFMSTIFYTNKDMDVLSLYKGLFWKNPILSIVFIIIILSLAGIPMTLGFIGKFYLLLLGISHHLWIVSVFILVSSIISVFYYLKMINILFIFSKNNKKFNFRSSIYCFYNPAGILIIGIAIGIIILGLYPQAIINLINFIHADKLN